MSQVTSMKAKPVEIVEGLRVLWADDGSMGRVESVTDTSFRVRWEDGSKGWFDWTDLDSGSIQVSE